MKVHYIYSPKLIFDIGLGSRYVSSTIANSLYTGLKPAYTLGISYSPTEKTSLSLASGLQASDVTPELNLSLAWRPRDKTQFSLGVSQTEQFANSLSGEYIVSRGISGSVTQNLFSSVTLAQLPPSYYFGSFSIYWHIQQWVNFVNSLTVNSGQQQAGSGGGIHPQYLYSIGLNFSL
jgi:hypothetical protein